MSDQFENTPGNETDRFKAQPFSAGAALRDARERLGLSVADVSNRLKFAPRQIEALEADEITRLPGIAFVRGFIRSYAKFLQIDPVPLLATLPSASGQPAAAIESASMSVPFTYASKGRSNKMVWMAAGVAGIILLGILVNFYYSPPQVTTSIVEPVDIPPVETQPESAVVPTSAVAVTQSAIQPSSSIVQPVAPVPPVTNVPVTQPRSALSPNIKPASATLSAPPSSQSSNSSSGVISSPTDIKSGEQALIHLAFDDESWVEVFDKNGKSLFAKLNPRGGEERVTGTPPFSLVIGNASGVRLYYQGKRIDLTPYNKAEVAHVTLK